MRSSLHTISLALCLTLVALPASAVGLVRSSTHDVSSILRPQESDRIARWQTLVDGVLSTGSPEVAAGLISEEAWPDDERMVLKERAVEASIHNEPEFDRLPWQPRESIVPWTLPGTPGEHAIYVQFRDAAGRAADSAGAILFTSEATFESTPVPPSPTPQPAATLEPTLAPLPSLTPRWLTPPPPRTGVPFPTWTPLPTARPQEGATTTLATWLAVAAALQGVALVLGLYLALRRGREAKDGTSPESGAA